MYCMSCGQVAMETTRICPTCGHRRFAAKPPPAPRGVRVPPAPEGLPIVAASTAKFCVQCSTAVLHAMRICPACGGRAFGAAPLSLPSVPPVLPSSPPLAPAPSRSWVQRGPLLALAVFCVLYGFGHLGESMRSVTGASRNVISIPGPGASIPGLSTRRTTVPANSNGIAFAAGVMLCLAGLLALNRATPGQPREGGLVDRGLARIGVFGARTIGAVPAVVALGAMVWLGYLAIARTDVHWSADAAAEAFKREVSGFDLAVTGNVMYARASEGSVVHMAHFTPALVRALDRVEFGVGGRVRASEYPLPGVVPLLAFAGLAGFAFVNRRRGTWRPVSSEEPDTMAARAFLLFALVNLYVVAWIVSGQSGVMFGKDSLHPDWIIPMLSLAPAGVAVIAVIHRKIEANQLPYATRRNWLSLYFAISLASPLWTYYFTDIEPGSPALLWLLAYTAAGAACWLAIEPDPQEVRS